MTSPIVVEAARAARSEIFRLAGDDAASLDERLATLLREAVDGTDVGDQLVDVLAGETNLQAWAAEFVATGSPPGMGGTKGLSPLPGHPDPVTATRYACPIDGLFVWYRRDVGQPVPDCRDHPGTRLEAVARA